MDKASERKAPTKKWGDTDHGIRDYGAGGKREQLDGLWKVPTITGGTFTSRIVRNEYCKEQDAKKVKADRMVESLINSGEPMDNISRPRAVANYRV
jgi:hypothetical protein